MSGIIVEGNFPTNTIKDYATKFYGEYDMGYEQYLEIFKKLNSDRAFEMDVLTDNFTVIPAMPEGSNVTYQSAQQRFPTVYNHVTFGGGFQISWQAKEDGKTIDLMEKYMPQLADAGKRTNEIVGANILNRGFNFAYTGGDGVELFTTLHPVANGTQANTLAVQAGLSEASLEDLCILAKKMRDFNGNIIARQTRKLIVPSELEFEAERILNSVARVATANNDLNAMRARGKFPEGFVVNNYLDSANRFFILTDAKDGLKFWERNAPKFKMDSAFESEVQKYKIMFRNSFGWTDFRGAVACGNI